MDVGAWPAIWLRDNCPCPDCRAPGSGQKLFQITDLPEDLVVTAVEEDAATVTVTFGPDGHRSVFGRDWLAGTVPAGAGPAGAGPPDFRTEDGKRLWSGPGAPLPTGDWERYRADPGHRAEILGAVLTSGFALLRGVPVQAGTVAMVAGTFGCVRETNYGRVFDVRVESTPANLASTGLALSPHTDNPYRDPVPTVQLLHCHLSAADGGDTLLVDGFAAAAQLRAEDPESFAVLTRTPVPFGYRDRGTDLRACQPLIELSADGRIRGIRFNNRSLQALRRPPGEVAAFYAAYRRWAQRLARPEQARTLRLTPGDCLIFDNTRVLHGRTGFTSTGDRLLQGCYADLDGLASTLAVLAAQKELEKEKEEVKAGASGGRDR
jgi:gamma-butyrobetaine dioxygenase